jgi:type I restriction enzyme S subunit
MKVEVIGETEDRITARAVEGSSAKYVPEGSILMVMRSGILRHSFPVAITDRVVTLNQDLRALTPRPGIVAGYVARYLALAANRVLDDCSKDGTTVNSIEVAALERVAVPVAPLPEQRRIVARIDALFAEIVEGEAALAAARKGLETFRRALLKAAVSGELTKDWRAANPPAETGHDLFVRIAKARAAKSPVKGRGRRNSYASPANSVSPPKTPDGWAWPTLGQLFAISTGSTPSRADPTLWNGGIPWVSSGEVAFCRIRSTHETISALGLGNRATRLHPVGTVLLAMIGEGKTRGQCAILDLAAANNQNAAAIRVSETPIPPEFIYHVLEERYFRSRRESQGGNQPALNTGKVSEMMVPLPPLAEQTEILRRVSDALAAVADTQALLDAEAADAARLKQSILKAAFEGRLTEQDSTEEPAPTLLAKVRAASPPKTVKSSHARRNGRSMSKLAHDIQ